MSPPSLAPCKTWRGLGGKRLPGLGVAVGGRRALMPPRGAPLCPWPGAMPPPAAEERRTTGLSPGPSTQREPARIAHVDDGARLVAVGTTLVVNGHAVVLVAPLDLEAEPGALAGRERHVDPPSRAVRLADGQRASRGRRRRSQRRRLHRERRWRARRKRRAAEPSVTEHAASERAKSEGRA